MKPQWVALSCILLAIAATASGQTPLTVEKIEISGISEESLSAVLRGDLQKLAGQNYDQKAASQIADRIQTELPEYVVTPTTSTGATSDRIVLVFIVAHNVNAKYFVESVEFKGTDKSKLSDGLWADMQKMIGHPVDDAKADQFGKLMEVELKRAHIRRSVEKGSDPQRVRILYDVPGQNSFGFDGTGSYHSRQKFSGRVTVAYTFYDFVGFKVDGINDASNLIERYAGFRYGAWTSYKRIRFNADYSSFRAQWSPGTMQAASAAGTSSDLYRLRDTFEPSAKITVTPGFRVKLGVTASQLQMQLPVSHFETVRTANGNADYNVFLSSSEAHELEGSYGIRVAGHVLGGASSFTRHLLNQSYNYRHLIHTRPAHELLDEHRVYVNVKLGRITGGAPMFERFSLGDTHALLGWNKYDISPLGANRMAYGEVRYANRYVSVFFESGSVWDSGEPTVVRNSIGTKLLLGNILHARGFLRPILNATSPGISIPLRKDDVRPIFTLGGGI